MAYTGSPSSGTILQDPSIYTAMERMSIAAGTITPRYTPETKLAMRLDCSPHALPYDRLTVHKLNDQTMLVWVINKGDHVVLEDEVALFPSDKLITQLRMLK